MAGMAGKAPDGTALPITELPNDLSYYMDVSSTAEVVRMIRSCDGQIFSGFAAYPSVYKKEIIDSLDNLTEVVAEMVAFPKDSAVIISGAGSSGRIAFMVARAFNAVLQKQKLPPCFHYLIAGGDEALLVPQEGAEDNAAAAVADLKRVLEGGGTRKPFSRIVYIGISCGLTATYVAAQVKHILGMKHGAAAVIGFNTPEQARATRAEGCLFSFLDVVQEMGKRIRKEEVQRFFLITPVLGPEALTGSTRMKSGSATKMLLELVIARALAKVFRLPCLGDLPGSARLFIDAAANGDGPRGKARVGWQKAANAPLVPASTALEAFEAASRAAYLAADQISELTEMMGQSWRNGGSVYYVGKGGLGLVGVLDASEQLPTFGTNPGALRAFVCGGWGAVMKPFERAPPPSAAKAPLAAGGAPLAAGASSGAKAPIPSEAGALAPGQQGKKQDSGSDSGSDDDEDDGESDEDEEESEDESDEDDEESEESEESEDGDGEGGKRRVPKTRTAEEAVALLARQAQRRRQQLFGSLSVDHFVKNILPTSKPTDTVVLLESRATGSVEEFPRALVAALLERIASKGVNLALVTVQVAPHDRLLCSPFHDEDASEASAANGSSLESAETVFADAADVIVKVVLPPATAAPILSTGGVDVFGEIAVKIVLNAASTTAQVMQGKVFGNRMIDLRVSNEKLFFRAARLVAEFAKIEPKAAEAVLHIIAAESGEEGKPKTLSEAVRSLAPLEKVVPTAILLASGKHELPSARQTALKARSIRTLLAA